MQLSGCVDLPVDGKPTALPAPRTSRPSLTLTGLSLEDLEKNCMQETVAGLDKALLILHAPMDDTVGIENAARIFQAARYPWKL